MNIRLACCAFSAMMACSSSVADKQPEWTGEPKPLRGDYQIYGGTLSEMLPPTPGDRKVAIMFKGPLAKDIFQQIGPNVKSADACSSATDFKERRRGDVSCTYTKAGGYTCYFGMDLRTGKSTYGAIC